MLLVDCWSDDERGRVWRVYDSAPSPELVQTIAEQLGGSSSAIEARKAAELLGGQTYEIADTDLLGRWRETDPTTHDIRFVTHVYVPNE